MKIWTYKEMTDKINEDLDLEDERFISPKEMVGYFNEALSEAESEIITIDEDYFLTKFFIPLVEGKQQYALPTNIYANKIRGIVYQNGSLTYEVKRFRRTSKFENLALTMQYATNDYYGYILTNASLVPVLELYPPARETAILPPSPGAFTPATMWFIRNCARIPVPGEFCNPEVTAPSQVNLGDSTIQTYSGTSTIGVPAQGVVGCHPGSIAYKKGDKIRFQAAPGGTLPAPLKENTDYFVTAPVDGKIKLATTLANAMVGTAIALTTQGTVYSIITVAATQPIIDAVLIDIPEFATFVMQWVKCRCFEKEGDPRLEGASSILIQQKKQMVDTLTNGIPDDDDTIHMDFSAYEEMS